MSEITRQKERSRKRENRQASERATILVSVPPQTGLLYAAVFGTWSYPLRYATIDQPRSARLGFRHC